MDHRADLFEIQIKNFEGLRSRSAAGADTRWPQHAAVIAAAGPTGERFIEFFTTNIRNCNTRIAKSRHPKDPNTVHAGPRLAQAPIASSPDLLVVESAPRVFAALNLESSILCSGLSSMRSGRPEVSSTVLTGRDFLAESVSMRVLSVIHLPFCRPAPRRGRCRRRYPEGPELL
jgi:hypothetical protein